MNCLFMDLGFWICPTSSTKWSRLILLSIEMLAIVWQARMLQQEITFLKKDITPIGFVKTIALCDEIHLIFG
jgi:hypothetical protein